MGSILENLRVQYKNIMSHTDPRTRNWFLLNNDPSAVLVLFFAYLAFVVFGSRYMKNRKAFDVPKSILFIYNIGLVLLSLYMFEELVVGLYEAKHNLICQKIHKDNTDIRLISAEWLYFVSKAIEFMDTVFMIVRKKFDQVTFLHCFHHSTMLLIWWMVTIFIPGGQSYFGATFNCLVHVLMYGYYGLSVIPSLREKLWWKKYITSFQLIQFFCTFGHVVHGIYKNCEYPMWGQYFLTGYMIIMIILFTNFYIHEYVQKAKSRKDKLTGSGSGSEKKLTNGSGKKRE